MNEPSSTPSNGFVELRDIESLDRFLSRSNGSPAIIFKHSNTCGISARAHAEMSRLEHPVGVVIVQLARELSNEIEARTGVAHETPQVFIIGDREVLWSASHGQIKAEAIESALQESANSKR